MIVSAHFETIDLGRQGYGETLLIQERYFQELLEMKRTGKRNLPNRLILVEHDPVYTLGKSGSLDNLKRSPEEVGAAFFKTNRGGDITYHGPGQIVGYPIFDLEYYRMGIAQYIWTLEQAVINAIAPLGIQGGRIAEASGVWLGAQTTHERKICAIGVKASRYVTMHGFAFNVNTDLGFFEHIIPCGIEDKGVTSVQKELGQLQDFQQMKQQVVTALDLLFLPTS